MTKGEFRYKNITLALGIAIGIYLLLRYVLPLFVPFIIAGIVSVCFYPVLEKMRNPDKGEMKKWKITLMVVLLYIVLLLVCGYLLCVLWKQGENLLLNIPFYQARVIHAVESCCNQIDTTLMIEKGSSFLYISTVIRSILGNGIAPVMEKISLGSLQMAKDLFGVLFGFLITFISTVFFLQDYNRIKEGILRYETGRNVLGIVARLKDTLVTYIKAQGIILLLNGIVCGIGFVIIEKPSAILWGFLVAVIDMLPVFGVGIVLIPYGLFMLLMKNYWKAVVLFATYIGCVIVRQMTEPKMIGDKIGILPIGTLLCIYVGLQLFGVAGVILGPAGFLIGKEIYHIICKKELNV